MMFRDYPPIVYKMKYIVPIKSSVMIDAETREGAFEQVSDALEEVRKRNCGNIDDEILSNATIIEAAIEEYNEE